MMQWKWNRSPLKFNNLLYIGFAILLLCKNISFRLFFSDFNHTVELITINMSCNSYFRSKQSVKNAFFISPKTFLLQFWLPPYHIVFSNSNPMTFPKMVDIYQPLFTIIYKVIRPAARTMRYQQSHTCIHYLLS